MRLVSCSFFVAALLAGCNSPFHADSPESGGLCIPDQYAIEIPDTEDANGLFDPEGGGYSVSIFIDAAEVAQSIDQYKSEVEVGGSRHFQSLYVMLSADSYFKQALADLGQVLPLEEHKLLFREPDDAFAWEVVERSGSGMNHWGTCVYQFTANGSYDCQWVLPLDGLVLTYPIDQANVHLYQDIDDYLRAKIDLWQCSRGEGQVDFK